MTKNNQQIIAENQTVGLFRRLGAMLYDVLLLCGLVIIAAIPPVLLNGGAINDGDGSMSIKELLFFTYWIGVIFLFYGWFWTHGGQTIGMVAWKHRVLDQQNQPISWSQAAIRLITSGLGLANLSIYLDPQRRGWHEKISGTQLVRTKTSVLPGKD